MRINWYLVVRLSLILMTCVSVSDCANFAASAASTSAQAVYNRRSLTKTWNDQYITMRAHQALEYKTDEFKDSNITVSTFNGEVLLAGQTPTEWQKAKAEEIIKQIPDVKEVYNAITLSSPSSTLTRMSDAWITTKVKTQLIASDDVDASQIKVVTENGTVYLMGIVPPEDAQAAVEVASETDGVSRVVKMFSYIRITKT